MDPPKVEQKFKLESLVLLGRPVRHPDMRVARANN